MNITPISETTVPKLETCQCLMSQMLNTNAHSFEWDIQKAHTDVKLRTPDTLPLAIYCII